MSSINIPNLDTAELRATTALDGGAVTMRLSGTADTRVMSSLDSLLKKIHEEALRLSVREVTVDLRDLEFMNSSCFKAFVSWLGGVQELETDKQYKIRFLSDDTKHWQRRSLGALSCFAVDLIRIETGGAPS